MLHQSGQVDCDAKLTLDGRDEVIIATCECGANAHNADMPLAKIVHSHGKGTRVRLACGKVVKQKQTTSLSVRGQRLEC